MKLCFIADARSPIAQNWIQYFIGAGHDVHVISSYPCNPDVLPATSVHMVPLAFSGLARLLKEKETGRQAEGYKLRSLLTGMGSERLRPLLMGIRYWVGPLDVYRRMSQVCRIVKELKPDLIHAMRIPFEGLLAAQALRGVPIPLLISVWGNDFTLYSKRFPLIARMTRQAMRRADALHSDCQRDLRLGILMGFDERKPTVVLPGSGGVQLDIFYPGDDCDSIREKWTMSRTGSIVFYPRRFRPGSVRTDTFFKAVPLVLNGSPGTTFICVGMAGHPIAEKWRRELNDPDSVRLLPTVQRVAMAELFRLADMTVSPSEHDGTPNTLLEAMACGSFPVVGDIESLREWIQDGVNGLLCDPSNPESLAQAIVRAQNDEDLRRQAAVQNRTLITERADYQKIMISVQEFYREVITQAGGRP
jgi:glycosyltransferase involved in cell wall biosynthesis